jgi:hypothetical protein
MHLQSSKLSESLRHEVEASGPDDLLDVVLELHHDIDTVHEVGSRLDRVRARQKAFARSSDAVRHAITAGGGRILEEAWINRTLRVQVPVKVIDTLAEIDDVGSIDVPGEIAVDP